MSGVFLGVPHAQRGVGQLRGSESFPDAARRTLADPQLRRNLGHATATIRARRALTDPLLRRNLGQAIAAIRAKRAAVVSEVDVPEGSELGVADAVQDKALGYHDLDSVDAVLTGCAAACAETGRPWPAHSHRGTRRRC